MGRKTIAILILLSGCSVPVPPGTSDPTKFSSATIQSAAGVELVELSPPNAKPVAKVDATACQRFQWDPAPTDKSALILLKSRAASLGANALTNVSYKHHNISFAKNCFGNIVASGTAVAIPSGGEADD